MKAMLSLQNLTFLEVSSRKDSSVFASIWRLNESLFSSCLALLIWFMHIESTQMDQKDPGLVIAHSS
jgi:hypothetical protein